MNYLQDGKLQATTSSTFWKQNIIYILSQNYHESEDYNTILKEFNGNLSCLKPLM